MRGDGSFSLDFYLARDATFAGRFAEGHHQILRKLGAELPTASERAVPFRFTRCGGCGFLVFTSRDDGERLACALCGAAGPTAPVADAELSSLAAAAHEAIGRRVVDLAGQTLLLVVQAGAPSLDGALGEICRGAGFAEVGAEHLAAATLAGAAAEAGAFDPAAAWSGWTRAVTDAEAAFADETPPPLLRLIEWLRHVDPGVRTAAAAPQEEGER